MNLFQRENLIKAFAKAINTYSIENDTNTPDFILAEYLVDTLNNLQNFTEIRDKWYGCSQQINNKCKKEGL